MRDPAAGLYMVTRSYTSSNPDPVGFHEGEQVRVGRRFSDDPEWPGWIWCENTNGKTGWVPVQYLRIEGDSGVALKTYTAHELTVASGDRLYMLDNENGWAWCKTESDEKGWVPLRNLELN